jgi:hypothetical protein
MIVLRSLDISFARNNGERRMFHIWCYLNYVRPAVPFYTRGPNVARDGSFSCLLCNAEAFYVVQMFLVAAKVHIGALVIAMAVT